MTIHQSSMRHAAVVLVSIIAPMLSAHGGSAQSHSPYSIEARVGGAMGSYEPAAADAHWGQKPAIALGVGYRLTSLVSVVAGYSRASFRCGGGFCREADIDFYSRGWDAGVQVGGYRGFWLRGGGVLHTFDIPAAASGEPRLVSDRAFGSHVVAGYGIGLGSRLAISPSLRYTRYQARFAGDAQSDRVDYLVADVGLTFRF